MNQIELGREPRISDRFDLDDIRMIREYNSLRHMRMTPSEVKEDIKTRGGKMLEWAIEHAVKVM